MITLQKIEIFKRYNSDGDGFISFGDTNEKELFRNNDWVFIQNFYQDIELINKNLVSNDYTKKALENIKANSDEHAFKEFIAGISFFEDFQKIAAILKEIQRITSIDDNTIWAGYDNAIEFLVELQQHIEAIENCSFSVLAEVNGQFLVTSTYQEMSLMNGWGDCYLQLAQRFDKLYYRLTMKRKEEGAKSSWWKRLFN